MIPRNSIICYRIVSLNYIDGLITQITGSHVLVEVVHLCEKGFVVQIISFHDFLQSPFELGIILHFVDFPVFDFVEEGLESLLQRYKHVDTLLLGDVDFFSCFLTLLEWLITSVVGKLECLGRLGELGGKFQEFGCLDHDVLYEYEY